MVSPKIEILSANDHFQSSALAVSGVSSGRTWGQALLQLVGLLGIVKHKGVQVPTTPDLELDGVLGVLLDASGWKVGKIIRQHFVSPNSQVLVKVPPSQVFIQNAVISMNRPTRDCSISSPSSLSFSQLILKQMGR